jgi:Lon protease-like protein
MSRRLPIFPLTNVVVPTALVPLHIFEPRYLALMDDLTGAELGTPLITPEFGIVGITRGHEVGGGEVRAGVGTVMRVEEAGRFPDGRWMVVVTGVGRFQVEKWLPDDPYPLAEVNDIGDEPWDDADGPLLATAQEATRRVLQMAVALGELSEETEPTWSDDPLRAAWEVCALALIGPFDRQRLLEAATVRRRLELLADELAAVEEMFAFRLGDR